jgi:arylsulfatase A-like enzyme
MCIHPVVKPRAMDEQIGRLRDELRSLGIENDTMLV